jgi:hypothetical protein
MTLKNVPRRRTAVEVAALTLAELAIAIHRDGDYFLGTQIPAATYDLARELAVSQGYVGPTARTKRNLPLQQAADKHKPHEFTELEVRARMMYDDETCARYFKQSGSIGTKDNLGNLAKNNPEAYRMLRISAISRGYRLPELRPVVQKQEPQGDGKFVLNAELARRASLPEGTKVDADQYAMILRLVNPEPKSND